MFLTCTLVHRSLPNRVLIPFRCSHLVMALRLTPLSNISKIDRTVAASCSLMANMAGVVGVFFTCSYPNGGLAIDHLTLSELMELPPHHTLDDLCPFKFGDSAEDS